MLLRLHKKQKKGRLEVDPAKRLATLNYYNRPKSGPTTSPEGVNDMGNGVSIKY